MKSDLPTYKPYGPEAILIEWSSVISKETLSKIQLFHSEINDINIKGVVEMNFVYSSLLVRYDNIIINFKTLSDLLKGIYKALDFSKNINVNKWEIPVCYDETFGIDLTNISKIKNISISDIINEHSKIFYTVYGLGFLPGFLYLGGLKKSLFIDRRASPRLKVPKGAVAIGGTQTGIYPQESPGGWQIIGSTPVPLFDISKKEPCAIRAGDLLKFKSVSAKEHLLIKNMVDSDNFNFKSLCI